LAKKTVDALPKANHNSKPNECALKATARSQIDGSKSKGNGNGNGNHKFAIYCASMR